MAKAVLRKKNGTGAINLPDLRVYWRAAVIRTVWYWHTHTKKYRLIEQDRSPRDKPMHLWMPYL